MTKYIQTNENGYVVSLTTEPILAGLFGGKPKDYKEVTDEEAEAIEVLLKFKHSAGEGLHINDLVKKLSS